MNVVDGSSGSSLPVGDSAKGRDYIFQAIEKDRSSIKEICQRVFSDLRKGAEGSRDAVRHEALQYRINAREQSYGYTERGAVLGGAADVKKEVEEIARRVRSHEQTAIDRLVQEIWKLQLPNDGKDPKTEEDIKAFFQQHLDGMNSLTGDISGKLMSVILEMEAGTFRSSKAEAAQQKRKEEIHKHEEQHQLVSDRETAIEKYSNAGSPLPAPPNKAQYERWKKMLDTYPDHTSFLSTLKIKLLRLIKDAYENGSIPSNLLAIHGIKKVDLTRVPDDFAKDAVFIEFKKFVTEIDGMKENVRLFNEGQDDLLRRIGTLTTQLGKAVETPTPTRRAPISVPAERTNGERISLWFKSWLPARLSRWLGL